MKLLIPLLFLTLTVCGQHNSKEFSEKYPIYSESVETICLKKPSIGKDSIQLNEIQEKVCGEKWNNSKPAGYSLVRPEQYDPFTFIEAVSRKVKPNSKGFVPCLSMSDEFPIDWVKRDHIDTLITLLDSRDSCRCFKNTLSSVIPKGFAEKGAYAATFIKSYKDKQPVSFGMIACPKIDKKLNKELIDWWEKTKNEY